MFAHCDYMTTDGDQSESKKGKRKRKVDAMSSSSDAPVVAASPKGAKIDVSLLSYGTFAPVSEYRHLSKQTCYEMLEYIRSKGLPVTTDLRVGRVRQWFADTTYIPTLRSCQTPLPTWLVTLLGEYSAKPEWCICGGLVSHAAKTGDWIKQYTKQDVDMMYFGYQAKPFEESVIDLVKQCEALASEIKVNMNKHPLPNHMIVVTIEVLDHDEWFTLQCVDHIDEWTTAHRRYEPKSCDDLVRTFDATHVECFYRNYTFYCTPAAFASFRTNESVQHRKQAMYRREKALHLGYAKVWHNQVWVPLRQYLICHSEPDPNNWQEVDTTTEALSQAVTFFLQPREKEDTRDEQHVQEQKQDNEHSSLPLSASLTNTAIMDELEEEHYPSNLHRCPPIDVNWSAAAVQLEHAWSLQDNAAEWTRWEAWLADNKTLCVFDTGFVDVTETVWLGRTYRPTTEQTAVVVTQHYIDATLQPWLQLLDSPFLSTDGRLLSNPLGSGFGRPRHTQLRCFVSAKTSKTKQSYATILHNTECAAIREPALSYDNRLVQFYFSQLQAALSSSTTALKQTPDLLFMIAEQLAQPVKRSTVVSLLQSSGAWSV